MSTDAELASDLDDLTASQSTVDGGTVVMHYIERFPNMFCVLALFQ